MAMHRLSPARSTALAATALGLSAGATHAAVVYVDMPDLVVSFADQNTVELDVITGDGYDIDYSFYFGSTGGTPNSEKPVVDGVAINNTILMRPDTNGMPVLVEGDLIDVTSYNSGKGFLDERTETDSEGQETGEVVGDWDGGATGYIGLALDPGGNLTYNYGWLLATYDDAGNTLTLHSYAYETEQNLGILAGSLTSLVPEPGSAALLAMGATGLLALRRRRRQS